MKYFEIKLHKTGMCIKWLRNIEVRVLFFYIRWAIFEMLPHKFANSGSA